MQSSGGSDITALIPCVIYLAVYVLVAIGFWKMFEKAGQPGWAGLIPIVNLYFLCKVAGRPGWWVILYFIPIVSLVISIIVWLDTAKAFGKGAGFAIGLIFLPFVFAPVLGFGDAQYQGPRAGV